MDIKLQNEFKKLHLYKRNIVSEVKIIWPIIFVSFVVLKPFFFINLAFSYVLLYSFIFATCFTLAYLSTNFLLVDHLRKVKKINYKSFFLFIGYLLFFSALTFLLVLLSFIFFSYFFPNNENLFSDIELNQSFLLVGFKEILEIVLFSHLFVCLVLIYGSKEAIKKKETKESDLNKNIPLDDSLAINMSIVNAAILKKSKKNLKEKELIIKGLNKNETIAMNSNQLLYVKSEGHYVRVYYFEKYKNKKIIKHSLIRNSIKNMEVIVENVSTIIRTHKSYIVNLEHINYVRCNMRKGLVSINKADVKLPIGKTYIDFLVNHINSMHPEVKLFH